MHLKKDLSKMRRRLWTVKFQYIKMNVHTLFFKKKVIKWREVQVRLPLLYWKICCKLFFMRDKHFSYLNLNKKEIILLFCSFKLFCGQTHKSNTLTVIQLFHIMCWNYRQIDRPVKPINKTLYTVKKQILTEGNVEDDLVSQLKFHITVCFLNV